MKSQIVKLVICLASITLVMPGDVSRFKTKTLASSSPQLLITEIDRIAADITVEILGIESLGSGIILNRQGDTYTVVTNQHVLRTAKSPYRIKTSDGSIHPAIVVPTVISTKYDLALLQFYQPDKSYQAATIGRSSSLMVGESIFAAGFPSQEKEDNVSKGDRRNKNREKPVLKTGRVTVILDQALEEGYQIGYTNDVKKGMSGGPLLNIRGEVIGINGKHAYPLWDAPDFYEDGSQPCPPLQELITRSSLAIPIEKIVELTPKLVFSPRAIDDNRSVIRLDSDRKSGTAELIDKMQVEVEARKNCEEVPNESQLIRP
ncbi:trypsin-like peptidase domain-containing protein [Pleurocapsales cyanobacterium LEGE 06147]|nr:trypsin-like peptidase domain-containing protein [Pleurocapsales cyanobacterium LEGE 06147]